jgi:Xaa-Pro aminopeptidase
MQAARTAGAESLVVTHLPDVRYLSGFTGSSAAVAIAGSRSALFTDGRYTAQARAEAVGLRLSIDKGSPATRALAWLAATGVTSSAFDAGQTTVAAFEQMRKALPASLAPATRRKFLLATDGLVATLREIKDEDEIARMRKAAALGCRLFDGALGYIVPGARETDVAAQLELHARLAGAEAMSFETIVASGERSALPHGRATTTKLPKRGFVTLDFGVLLDGYCSDMTRTVHLGNASQRERDVYHSVLEAQQAAAAAVGPGVRCSDVDEAARSVLRKAKLDKAFSHSTGHGVGLQIHEGPRIAAVPPITAGTKKAAKPEPTLQPGMVITIEPGAYLAGSFGVRIEDMVLVTAKGGDVLTAASPKEWIQL